ncbi:uncharacterized protein EI97DRAFT_466197 [Westerdykella ornata]|uniref:Carrier domain-containing protein n=1 Tax=Westerdykella ornata TaxID=318751 RepID=A0A6A6JN04_WESOR|nr:uncharacterized protein EI97DRAFT_466197 [Westerdykella ornata]KAF2277308.1 hypothetical protein EI97DRAFT_466197 [Westerdykella ornata]
MRSHILDQPLFNALRFVDSTSGSSKSETSIAQNADEGETETLSKRLASVTSLSAQIDMVLKDFRRKLSFELGVEEEALDLTGSSHDMGVDSLLAVTLRGWFWKEMDANVSVFDIMAEISAEELCHRALDKSPLRIRTNGAV